MKVILVDDEKVIVDGLKKIIERYIPECEVIGVAYNGLEGYKLIQKRKPDIVITDIRMPQADGLDMINMLIDADCQTKFILLSGYADFEYARKGMQLGVKFYLNKPVEELELRDCVCQVIAELRESRSKLQEVDDLRQEIHSRIQESALRDILDLGNDNTVQVEELLQIAGIPTEGKSFVCALLEFDNHLGHMKELGLAPVFRHVDRAFGRYGTVYRFRYSGSQAAVVIAHGEGIEYGNLVLAVQRMKEAVFQESKLSMTVGIGTVQHKVSDLSQSFEEARYALSYKIIKGIDAVIPFHEISSINRYRNRVPEDLIAKLESGIDNMDQVECVGIIREIFRGMEAASPMDLQLQCLNILLLSVRKMSFQKLEQNDLLGRNILSLEGISRFRTLGSLEEWMVQVIQEIIAFKLEHNIPKKKDIIAEIKDYVSTHYDEPISLADLAARFFISPYYLSQLFKQKTGDTYINYLAQCRIGKAKELLEKTDLKVYEICQKVGYSDKQYFARLFEKLTGSRPSDYRKNLPRA
ncbi:response regulator [Paenibacillus glycanilyticus]|uniref:DNA-binding response regulator n=1 Tax=Paenibacillus glycanilyticus TaxID=126569 RepID=A0ABQ6GAI2_9BACL|nr:helix-turn-helix domain-containing protein [Paenibacillus glycanilyticus]GLX66326.1 DNA-binding response regulator [Paenibacillus glycanilyticus]